jgi:hypothetical protein
MISKFESEGGKRIIINVLLLLLLFLFHYNIHNVLSTHYIESIQNLQNQAKKVLFLCMHAFAL